MTKVCRLCKKEKDEKEFSIQRKICKECRRIYMNKRYASNKSRHNLSRKSYFKRHPEARKRFRENYKHRHPERERAERALRYAVSIGLIKRMPCIICNNTDTHGHHENYSKPLEVIWLCLVHHRERHKIINCQHQVV